MGRRFEDITATSRTPPEINHILMIEYANNLNLALENYVLLSGQGVDLRVPLSHIRSSAYSLWFKGVAIWQRNLPPEECNKLRLDVVSNSFIVLEEASIKMLLLLDKIRLLRIDIYEPYDSTDTLAEDKAMFG